MVEPVIGPITLLILLCLFPLICCFEDCYCEKREVYIHDGHKYDPMTGEELYKCCPGCCSGCWCTMCKG